jgi:hypothetical protein
MLLLALLLLAIGIACYSLRELQSQGKLRWQKEDASFWGNDSWLRKYKLDDKKQLIEAPHTWYYRFFKIKYKERFPLSATFLVNFTDGYHAMQSASFVSLAGCISLLSGIPFYFVWPGIIFVHFLTYKFLSK